MNQNRQSQSWQAAQMHRNNILKRLEHRLQVAHLKGEPNLICQLEAEKSYYTY
jgi:hypothetical protein